MLDFFPRNWGNLASVAGLIFSILAFVFSKRASLAARQARDSVLRRALGEDMNDANRAAIDIVTYVGLARGDVALVRIAELLNQTSYLMARWDGQLSEPSKNNLLAAREQMQAIHELLVKNTIEDLAPRDRIRLARSCQHVSGTFSQEYGPAIK